MAHDGPHSYSVEMSPLDRGFRNIYPRRVLLAGNIYSPLSFVPLLRAGPEHLRAWRLRIIAFGTRLIGGVGCTASPAVN